jgi:stress response protein YsnF
VTSPGVFPERTTRTSENDVTTYDAGQVTGWIGQPAYDTEGHKIGHVDAVYEDDDGSGPEWFAIKTGWFGTHITFVPVRGALVSEGRLVIRWTKDIVRDAPRVEADGHLTHEEEMELYRYYGMEWSPAAEAAQREPVDAEPEVAQEAVYVSNDDAMTRSEEELRVQTVSSEVGRVRLKKWIETEDVTVTVPVRREMARVVVESADGQVVDVEMPNGADGEDIVVWKEEIVVEKQIVPKERVRLEKDVVEEQRVVSDEVRKERITVETDIP